MKNIKIENMEIDKLNPAIYNPRKWNKQQENDLRKSIQRFGIVDPIIVNKSKERNNIVIGGHFRLHVVKKLKHKTIPVVYLDISDIEKEKELNLRLNKAQGEWDLELLKNFDFGVLQDVGFSKDDIVRKLLGEAKIDMIYNDPIYSIQYNYQRGLGRKNKYKCEEVKDNFSPKEYRDFLSKALKNALKFTKKDVHIFTWNDQNNVGLIQDLYQKHKIQNKRTCLWIKNNQNVTPQVAFNKCYEACCYGTRGKPYLNKKQANFTEIMNPEVGNGNQCFEDIAELFDIWFVKRLPTNQYEHATHKPIKLHERPLKRCTRLGDNVLDMFGGSGSTLLACKQLERTAFLIEKSPTFCDLICKRFKQYQQNKIK